MEVVQDGIFEPLRGEDFDVRGAFEDVAPDVEYGACNGGHDGAFFGVGEGDLSFGPLLFFLVRGLIGCDQEFNLVGLGFAGYSEWVGKHVFQKGHVAGGVDVFEEIVDRFDAFHGYHADFFFPVEAVYIGVPVGDEDHDGIELHGKRFLGIHFAV